MNKIKNNNRINMRIIKYVNLMILYNKINSYHKLLRILINKQRKSKKIFIFCYFNILFKQIIEKRQ